MLVQKMHILDKPGYKNLAHSFVGRAYLNRIVHQPHKIIVSASFVSAGVINGETKFKRKADSRIFECPVR